MNPITNRENENRIIALLAKITAGQLRRLYECLEDEATPYELRVGRGESRCHKIALYCHAENMAYFKNMLTHEI